MSLQHEKVEAYRQAYIEEQAFRESAKQALDRLAKFLREAGIIHPRGHELNEENDRLAREAEEEECVNMLARQAEEEQRKQDEERLKAQEAEDDQREQEEERLKAEEAERFRRTSQ